MFLIVKLHKQLTLKVLILRYVTCQAPQLRYCRPLEMTSNTWQKCGNLRYAITYNVIWANLRTEFFYHHWLCALAMFDITSFPAFLSGIESHFKFCRYRLIVLDYIIPWQLYLLAVVLVFAVVLGHVDSITKVGVKKLVDDQRHMVLHRVHAHVERVRLGR